MGKMTRRLAPKKTKEDPPPVVTADLPVETSETLEEIQPEIRTKKNNLPPDTFTIECGKCGNERVVHIKDPGSYTNEQIAQLFVDREGSHDPPRCGFCKRKADLASGKYKPKYEPAKHRQLVVEAPAA